MTKRKGENVAKTAVKRNFAPLGPPPAEYLEFVGSLRNLRLSQGIKTRDLADHLKVTIGVISAWETGRHAPHPHDLVEWVKFLGFKLTAS